MSNKTVETIDLLALIATGIPAQFYGPALENLELYKSYTGSEEQQSPFFECQAKYKEDEDKNKEINVSFEAVSFLAKVDGIGLGQDFQIAASSNLLHGLEPAEAFAVAWCALKAFLNLQSNATKIDGDVAKAA